MQKDFEYDDPMELIGVALPTPPGHDVQGEMALCFVEEFALMGFTAKRIMDIFKNPFYKGPYAVYKARGEQYVRELIAQVTINQHDSEEATANA